MNNLGSSFLAASLLVSGLAVFSGCAADTSSSEDDSQMAENFEIDAKSASSIAEIARANVGRGACSTNSAGSKAFDSSCTGNGGEPEYWCADFARWVWAKAGASYTSDLTAAAGSFYVYGQAHRTLHSKPAVGDAVVFNYAGHGYADHVAIVTAVYSNGTIETVSGDWNGESGSEARFSSTSHVVLNAPAYSGALGGRPAEMGMTISGFVAPAGLGAGGSSPAPAPAPSSAMGCYSPTLGKEMPANACVQSRSDSAWYQCDDGAWVGRFTDPTACDGIYPL